MAHPEIGRTRRGSYSPKRRVSAFYVPSRQPLLSLEPLLRTLLRTLSPCKIHCKTPSKNPSQNLSHDPQGVWHTQKSTKSDNAVMSFVAGIRMAIAIATATMHCINFSWNRTFRLGGNWAIAVGRGLGKSKGGLTNGGLSPKFSEKIGGKSFLENRAFSGQIGAISGPVGAFSGPIGTNSSAPHSHGGRAEIAPKGPFFARLAG